MRIWRMYAAAIVVVAIGAFASAAMASPPSSGVWEYVETVPSAGGGTVEAPSRHVLPLTPNEQQAVAAAPPTMRAILSAVAGSKTYGAPSKRIPSMPAKRGTGKVTARKQRPVAAAPLVFDRGGRSTDPLWIALLVLIPASFGLVAASRLLTHRNGSRTRS